MGILKEYFVHKKKFRSVRRWKKSPIAARERERIILDFLNHIKGHVFAIKDIKQDNYDQYIYYLVNRRGLAIATIHRYKYALREFFILAGINIPVTTRPKKKHSQRMKKLIQALRKSSVPSVYHGEIIEITGKVFCYGNPKK